MDVFRVRVRNSGSDDLGMGATRYRKGQQMRKLLANMAVIVTVLGVLWVADVARAGEAEVFGDCDNWYVTIVTTGSNPSAWSVTLDGVPVTDGTYTIPDTETVSRTFTVVWTKGDRSDVKLFTGERNLECGTTTTTETTVPDSTTSTTTPPTTTSTQPTVTSTTTGDTTSTTIVSTTVPHTLPFTGTNPVSTAGTGVALILLGGLTLLTATARTDDRL